MRFAAPLCFGFIAAAGLAGPAHPQDTDDSLRIYGVHINRTPKQPWTGVGIYLGKGIVITAAHVAGLGFWRKPQVEIAGQDVPTDVLKDGHYHNVDLTLLSVDERQLPVRLGLRRMTLCQNSPWVGEEVIVANSEGVARSHVMSPYLLPPAIPAKFQTVISYVAETGNSGSGVFDANKKCLLGIISGKISQDQFRQENGRAVREPHDVAKYFVPASTIADFIPPEVRF
jgi:Trypsin-like peptidase domain